MRGFKKGKLSDGLQSIGGIGHKKGDTVYYRRMKRIPDKDGFILSHYEWHYLDTEMTNLVRTFKRTIEGLPVLTEKFL